MPTDKPLSIFDRSALAAAFPEFWYADCIPFHKRLTPVSTQQAFNALQDREELTYPLDNAYEVKTSFERPGFEKDLKINSTKAHDQASPYERKHALDSGETHPAAEMSWTELPGASTSDVRSATENFFPPLFANIISKQNLVGTVKLSTLSKAGC